MQLDPKEELVLFDVTSLFTRVPAMEALRLLANKLYSNDNLIDVRPPIRKTVFFQIGKLALNNVVMLTNDVYYIQKEGVAMGSPLSSLLANVLLTQFDERFKAMKSKWYYRNVDDIFMTLHEDVIQLTFEVISSLN